MLGFNPLHMLARHLRANEDNTGESLMPPAGSLLPKADRTAAASGEPARTRRASRTASRQMAALSRPDTTKRSRTTTTVGSL